MIRLNKIICEDIDKRKALAYGLGGTALAALPIYAYNAGSEKAEQSYNDRNFNAVSRELLKKLQTEDEMKTQNAITQGQNFGRERSEYLGVLSARNNVDLTHENRIRDIVASKLEDAQERVNKTAVDNAYEQGRYGPSNNELSHADNIQLNSVYNNKPGLYLLENEKPQMTPTKKD